MLNISTKELLQEVRRGIRVVNGNGALGTIGDFDNYHLSLANGGTVARKAIMC